MISYSIIIPVYNRPVEVRELLESLLHQTCKDFEVLIIEDIVDSGRTLSYLAHMLEKRGPKSLRICTLLDKPACRVSEVDVAYTGFEIDDLFVVGFGLDYAQKYRNLPYIGELKIKED